MLRLMSTISIISDSHFESDLMQNVKMSAIGSKIKALRKAKMSQEEMERLSGVPRATLQRIEAGNSRDYRDIEAIMNVLGITPAILWDPPKASASLSPSAIPGPLSASDGAVILAELAKISPDQRAFLLAILFRDEKLFLGDMPEILAEALRVVRKAE